MRICGKTTLKTRSQIYSYQRDRLCVGIEHFFFNGWDCDCQFDVLAEPLPANVQQAYEQWKQLDSGKRRRQRLSLMKETAECICPCWTQAMLLPSTSFSKNTASIQTMTINPSSPIDMSCALFRMAVSTVNEETVSVGLLETLQRTWRGHMGSCQFRYAGKSDHLF